MTKSYVYIVENDIEHLYIDYAEEIKLFERMQRLNPKLVYFEEFENKMEAAERMKSINEWPERKKKMLVNLVNPRHEDWKNEIFKNKKEKE